MVRGPMRLDGRALGAGMVYTVMLFPSFETQMFPMPSMAIANGPTMPLVIVARVFCLPLEYMEMLPSEPPLLAWKLATQRLPEGSKATPTGRLSPVVMVALVC